MKIARNTRPKAEITPRTVAISINPPSADTKKVLFHLELEQPLCHFQGHGKLFKIIVKIE
jgi:hypothetical protein